MIPAATRNPKALTILPHSGMNVREYFSLHFQGAVFPLTAGVILFGWRAAAVIMLVFLGTLAGVSIWRKIGSRGAQMNYAHALWLATLLALMLPAQLAANHLKGEYGGELTWPLPLAAGLLLAMFIWLLGGLGSGRIHPVIVTYLFIAALFWDLLIPHVALDHNRLLLGDVLNSSPLPAQLVEKEPWLTRLAPPGVDGQREQPATESLSKYTSGREKPARGWLPLQGLLRDNLPPLEDLIIGGRPAPIGMGSAVAVIIGGLFLLYRGVIDYRIPMIIVLVEFAALLILPIPSAVTDHTQWHWLAMRRSDVGWAAGITFANYEIMASPTLFMAFFLATAGPLRPMARRARTIYAILIGVGSAALQLYMDASVGPYIALLGVSLLTPVMDYRFNPRPLV
jgi:hypothetical protein